MKKFKIIKTRQHDIYKLIEKTTGKAIDWSTDLDWLRRKNKQYDIQEKVEYQKKIRCRKNTQKKSKEIKNNVRMTLFSEREGGEVMKIVFVLIVIIINGV